MKGSCLNWANPYAETIHLFTLVKFGLFFKIQSLCGGQQLSVFQINVTEIEKSYLYMIYVKVISGILVEMK